MRIDSKEMQKMSQEIRLPKLGDTMEDGTIVGCRVKIGDEIHRGTVMFDIETDKATIEVESSEGGIVRAILIEIGQTVPVGSPLLILGAKDEAIPQSYIDALGGNLPAATSPTQASAPVVTPPPFPPHVTAGPTSFSIGGVELPHYTLGQKVVASRM